MIFDQHEGKPILKIDPQPEYVGNGWWWYNKTAHSAETLADYLFHDVYGDHRANSTVIPGDQVVIYIEDIGWCWQGVEDVTSLLAESGFGVQEPPQDYRIFNRRQPAGSFRPLSEFFVVNEHGVF